MDVLLPKLLLLKLPATRNKETKNYLMMPVLFVEIMKMNTLMPKLEEDKNYPLFKNQKDQLKEESIKVDNDDLS